MIYWVNNSYLIQLGLYSINLNKFNTKYKISKELNLVLATNYEFCKIKQYNCLKYHRFNPSGSKVKGIKKIC